MLLQLKKIFCFHIFEYELNSNQVMTKECRKCGISHVAKLRLNKSLL